MDSVLSFLKSLFFNENFLFYFIFLVFAVTAAFVSEKSGTVNIAIEGFMVLGAFILAFSSNYQIKSSLFWRLLFSFFLVFCFSLLFAFLFAFCIVEFKTDQVIFGTALNILFSGIAMFFVQKNYGKIDIDYSFFTSKILEHSFYIFYLLPLLLPLLFIWFLYKKTVFGLRQRAIGEDPSVALSVGINVKFNRYLAICLSCIFASFAGALFAIFTINTFHGNVGGYGYIAIAILILSKWRYVSCILSTIFFTLILLFVNRIQFLDELSKINPEVYFFFLNLCIWSIIFAVGYFLFFYFQKLFSKKNKLITTTNEVVKIFKFVIFMFLIIFLLLALVLLVNNCYSNSKEFIDLQTWFTKNKDLLNILPFALPILILVFKKDILRAPKNLGRAYKT